MHGGSNEKTFARVGENATGRMSAKGAWSIKVRKKVGVKVGCYKSSESDWTRAQYTHYVMCAHGTRRQEHAGIQTTSRAKALKVAKLSHEWCGHCTKAHEALTQTSDEEE